MRNKMFILIIGVILSVVLIGGGTYAWLTYSATVVNSTSNFTSRNFTFNTTTGTAVTNLYPFPHQPIRAGITSGNGYIVLTVSKVGSESPKASSMKIMAKFNTMEVNVADYIKVAVCKSSTPSNCNNSPATAIPSSTNASWLVVNKSISNNTSEQVIYDDTSTFNVNGAVSATYYVYFWLNSEVVTNDNAATLAQSHIIGDVYFYATQGE